MLTVARYRFRTTFRLRRGGYLAIVLLIGLVGGVAMGSIAGARRTQSSYPAFLLVVGGGIVLANLVAALPGRNAAHTPTALVLRAE